MGTTLTIRADDALRDALTERARAQGKTLSQLVREILEAALVERPLEKRAGHLRGRLMLREQATQPWRQSLRQHNWRS
ncbi:MAG: ribbon-helix-helix protein, CopG family [Gemmatimonadota bacterium]|nr:MAG: ribbon-helix-helix protein, CopG family [Gemmatimonadota bacterium]